LTFFNINIVEYKGIISSIFSYCHAVIHEGSAALAAIQICPEPGSMHFRQSLLCSYRQHLNSGQEISSIDSKTHVITKLMNTLFNADRIFKNISSWQEITSDRCRIKSCPCIFHKRVLPDKTYENFLYSITACKYQEFQNTCALPCFYSKTNQMHDISNLFYFGTTIYMFRTVSPSIVRSLRLYIQHQVYVIQVLYVQL
jgi:hypothetical protein